MSQCENGFCRKVESTTETREVSVFEKPHIIYISDPMCSWCYGISSIASKVQAYCDEHDLGFEIVVGGLREGGPEVWTPEFRNFLRNEWAKIHQATGQIFGDSLLELEYFDYDTTPSCDAIVIAKMLMPEDNQKGVMQFLALLQQKFYQMGKDPKEPVFYQSICETIGMDFHAFKSLFGTEKIRTQTRKEFQWRSSVGVQGFPTFLFADEDGLRLLSSGYTSFERIVRRIPE